jgi:hypothetical protein
LETFHDRDPPTREIAGFSRDLAPKKHEKSMKKMEKNVKKHEKNVKKTRLFCTPVSHLRKHELPTG